MGKNLYEVVPGSSPSEHDCDCGCNGAGDCGGVPECAEVVEPTNRSRRRLVVGGATIAVVATLANRRAFACTCGPISRAGSLNTSQSGTTKECGGMTPGYWKNHSQATSYALGGAAPGSVKLGDVLSALKKVDSTSAGTTFKAALCNSGSAASHWACAILNAATPSWNPSYGYTISSMNTAILNAYNSGKGASGTTILNALQALENDYNLGVVPSKYNINQSIC